MSNPGPEHLATPSLPVRFGAAGRYELQPAERRLLVDGQPATLGARALDLLIALVARPGSLIGKNELIDRVWPGLVVEEANLQVQISNLRKVVGSTAIATVPGQGYRFVAPILGGPTPAPSPQPAAGPGVQHLVGRSADLAHLEALLTSGDCITLVGPSGVGKTSLARAAAERVQARPGRCVWVDLAPLSQAAQLPAAVARALQLPWAEGQAPALLQQALQEQARAQPLLLVLDNAEHLVDACAELVGALGRLPGVQRLVTSQLPLGVAGEQVQRLAPLALPDDDATTIDPGDGALGLLIRRIRAADTRFTISPAALASLSEICVQLDGLPLALEMAAARVPLMGVQAVRDALAQRFPLLSRGHRGADTRHRTLQQALEWSYRLLSPDEQRLFRALGVFAGGFTLELALAVLAEAGAAAHSPAHWALIDGLAVLVDRSLVTVSADDPPRYRLLESLRAFALQALADAPDEGAALRPRHAAALAALLQRYQPGSQQTEALCLAEMENIREAIAWAREHDLCWAAQLTTGAAWVSTFSVWRSECTQWLRALQPRMEAAAGEALPGEVQAAWWTEMARTAGFLGDPQASAAARRARELWLPLQQPSQALFATVVWVRTLQQPGAELDEACAALQAMAAAMPDSSTFERLRLHGALTRAALIRGDHAAVLAGRLAEMALARELGSDDMVDAAESNAVNALNALGRHVEAADRGQALLARIDRHKGDASPSLPWVLAGLLEALIHTGRLAEAALLVPRTWAASRRFTAPTVLCALPWLAAAQGRFEVAAQLAGHVRQRYAARQATPEPSDEAMLQTATRLADEALAPGLAEALQRRGQGLADEAAEALSAS